MEVLINGNLYQVVLTADPGSQVMVPSADSPNAQAVAALPAVAGKTNFLTGVLATYTGATSAGSVLGTIVGLLGGTITIPLPVPAGAAVGATPLALKFNPPLPASAVNTAITFTVPALGAGNLHSTATVMGFTR